jgi:hypothetical protein
MAGILEGEIKSIFFAGSNYSFGVSPEVRIFVTAFM